MLDSIAAQDRQDFLLRVRDDGSSDDTMAILESRAAVFGERLIIEEDRTPTGSAKANFAKLMEVSDAEYILFADQDDVWLPNRVSETMRLLEEAEALHGAQTPVFAFTDVIPVDANMSQITDSFFRFKKVDPDVANRLNQCLVCTPMLGCAAGINRSLASLATPIPVEEVTGHDWWALLLASATGRAIWSSARTVKYRLHGGNASGQVETAVSGYARTGGKRAKVQRGMTLRRQQGAAVAARLAEKGLADDAVGTINRFVALGDASALGQRWGLVRGGYLYPDWTRTLAMLALC